MNLILLKEFNNYYNRRIKKLDTVNDYLEETCRYLASINFNPNDGLSTTQIINWSEDWAPDYMVCVNDDNNIDSRWFVVSASRTRGKQYQLTLKRDVLGDYLEDLADSNVYVEKGVITDSESPLLYNKEGMLLNQIKTSVDPIPDSSNCQWLVAYIKKNTLGTQKTEDITVNIEGAAPGNYIEIPTPIASWKFYDYTTRPMKVADTYKTWVRGSCPSGTMQSTWYKLVTTMDSACETTVSFPAASIGGANPNIISTPPAGFWPKDKENNLKKMMHDAWFNYGTESMSMALENDFDLHSTSDLAELNRIANVGLIKDSTGKYYSIQLSIVNSKSDYSITSAESQSFEVMKAVTRSGLSWTIPGGGEPNQYCFGMQLVNGQEVTVLLTENKSYAAKAVFPATPIKTDNPLYDIITFPYPGKTGEVRYIYGGSSMFIDGNTNLISMYAITTALGGTNGSVLDLQLLPYCPIQSTLSATGAVRAEEPDSLIKITDGAGNFITGGFIVPDGQFHLNISKPIGINRPYTTETLNVNTSWTAKTSNNVEAMHNIVSVTLPLTARLSIIDNVSVLSAFGETYNVTHWNQGVINLSIDFEVPMGSRGIGHPATVVVSAHRIRVVTNYDNDLITDKKISNECDLYRLVSPNYNGEFEFSVVKNDSSINYFHVDCDYKPYNPYIHVGFDFKGLYGSEEFHDARGLICGGDFSIGIVNDAFQAYEIQNKNYQNIFLRQIQSMDVNNKIARDEAVVSAIAGTLQGAGTGAAGGMAMGGGAGAAIGAVVGGVASGMAGAADVHNLALRQNEARSLAADMHNMSLQNIQALPQSISKTSAMNNNNQKFPFVERYTCTDVEKEAFKNKLKFDGMTVNIIDTLKNWVSGTGDYFFRGSVIRCDGFQANHLLSAINDELSKGVYL